MASTSRLASIPPTCALRVPFKPAPCPTAPRALRSYTVCSFTVPLSTASHRPGGPVIPAHGPRYRIRTTRTRTLSAGARTLPLHTQATPSAHSFRAEYEQLSTATQPSHTPQESPSALPATDSQEAMDEVPLPQPQVLSASWLDLSFTSTLSVQQILFGHTPLESSMPHQPLPPLVALDPPAYRTDDHDAPSAASIAGRSYWSFNP
ncbi:hypothetical protein H4R34_005400 [Dimargaris verticillata]|uniref:Uncharacterized protein n=1 Tax=Dimargaris verticillata TaxID=2761393 RepID=A0A9W8EAS2_9FUNG|nr:hypothetical protein H4R34_005400 [Dimargaris verticillata]